MNKPMTETTKGISLSDIIECLKKVACDASDCGEGEYRGAMWALNEIEKLAGLPFTENI